MKILLLRKFVSETGGSAAIEFAMVVPVLLTLSVGIFEYGRLYWTQEALMETATAAVRCMGILESSCASGGAYSGTNTTSYIQSVARSWGVAIPTADITLTNSTSCAGVSGFSQVQISFVFKTIVPGLIPIPLRGTTLTAQACYPNV